jgi:dCTP deaminase
LILSHDALIESWKSKRIRFKPDITENQIKESSIDLRMGETATRINENPGITIRPAISVPLGLFRDEKIKNSLIIQPRELVIVFTKEHVSLPDDLCAHIEGRSSYARYGLGIHVTSPYINPLFHGPIALELYNFFPNKLEVKPDDKICQLIISQVTGHLPPEMAKRGSYIGQKSPQPRKMQDG